MNKSKTEQVVESEKLAENYKKRNCSTHNQKLVRHTNAKAVKQRTNVGGTR